MPSTLNIEAYKRLLNEDIDWVRSQRGCIEREHVIAVLEWARDHRYEFESGTGTAPPPDATRSRRMFITDDQAWEAVSDLSKAMEATGCSVDDIPEMSALKWYSVICGRAEITPHVKTLAAWAVDELVHRKADAGHAKSANIVAPPPDATPANTADAARLRAFEDVGSALWPFVRYFALAGGHPSAIAAVVALGKLLGHTDASQSTMMEIAERVRAETLNEVAGKLEELLRGRVLSRDIPGIADDVRAL